eukprot:Opistho-2@12813
MLEKSLVVALMADAESIIARVSKDEERPLLQGDARERVYKLLEQRRGAYDFAHLATDTTGLSVQDVAERIIACKNEWNAPGPSSGSGDATGRDNWSWPNLNEEGRLLAGVAVDPMYSALI